MKHVVAAMAAVGLLAGGASAQSREDEVAIAVEILEMTGEVNLAMEVIMDMMPLIEGNVRAAFPDLTTRQYMQIAAVYEEEFRASRDDFATVMTDAYVDAFTYEDLVGLRDFYRTDLGQRYTSALGDIQRSSSEAGEMVGMRVDQRAAPRIRAIILGD